MPAQPLDATPAQQQAHNATTHQQQDESAAAAAAAAPKKFPKGVVLGADGKPCRSCTSFASWAAMTKNQTTTPTTTTTTTTTTPTPTAPTDCPPDVEALGRSTWTLLHSITATYPRTPPPSLQAQTRTFISALAQLYPCWTCASDFQAWLREDGNAPRVSSRDEFGRWMCEAHNAVNVKLGKRVFDCERWEERWRTGWADGRCG
ncbi:putative FAD dependent sulfhydryl oxidase Erv1 [Saccharata proteae CBS 121410]|uniref:Sulfhydryl oxidase n=1 Tax=Saccharata proteae CBS 121410 TaxID=1314787 RepID=A0A9P4HYR4_9PEZI|nr:putative FAD dependent sulfhydryl oxidase Erv1 [Saccharata proteae CBS 121410]